MEDPFAFLPKEEVLFIDTSAFSLCARDGRPRDNLSKNQSADYLLENAARLRCLMRRLEVMSNWTIISEVVQEVENANICLELTRSDARSAPVTSAIGHLLHERKHLLELISDEYRNASLNLTDELTTRVEELIPRIHEIFKANKGRLTTLDTDCKIISTALAYSETTPVYVFSHDSSTLLKTLAHYAREANLPEKQIFISDGRRGTSMPAGLYRRDDERTEDYVSPNKVVVPVIRQR